MDIENDALTIRWNAPTITANTVALYNVEVLLEGQMVYSEMTAGTSLSATRGDIQEEGDVVRTQNTQYTVVVVARNSRGGSERTSQTFTMPAGETHSQLTHRTR